MSDGNETENLRILGRKLRENLGITEFTLINFCDSFKKYALRLTKQLSLEHDDVTTVAELINRLNELQGEYTKFKTSVEMMLFNIPEK